MILDLNHPHIRAMIDQEKDRMMRELIPACPECKARNDEYWDEMWAELHGDIRSGIGV